MRRDRTKVWSYGDGWTDKEEAMVCIDIEEKKKGRRREEGEGGRGKEEGKKKKEIKVEREEILNCRVGGRERGV